MLIKNAIFAIAAVLLSAGPRVWAAVTILQNGVSPSAEYAGCKDTWISDGAWERGHNNARATLLRCGGPRHILLRFDLGPIPKGDKVHKAVLRLADAGFPRRGADGKYPAPIQGYALTRAWSDTANWREHTRTDYRKVDEGDWKTPGGEYDTTRDFGQGAGGLICAEAIVAGRWGHMHELDITEAVRRWHGGELANHGLLLKGGGSVASSEWPVRAYRPQLIVDHGGKAAGIEALRPPPGQLELDPVAKTPDAGKAKGEYGILRVGLNANCALRGASTDAYVKENVAQFPGSWGWRADCRIGGVAGDFSRTLLYFDLREIPKAASIKRAKLVCALVRRTAREIRSYRYGAFLLRLPGTPGWSAGEVTTAEAEAGKPWPGGGLMACTGAKPLALATVTQKEVEERGRKREADAAIEFDLTGAVRAWVSGTTPNCGIVLDNRIEGGAYDIYSSRAWEPGLRPYLEIELSPALDRRPEPVEVDPSLPPGGYWVERMRQVHRRFKGKPGTLAQYGDSITITMAFLAQYGFANKIEPRNATPQVKKECEAVANYADLSLWRKWKGGQYGNAGVMRASWMHRNVGRWQKELNPETAVIMFGTNGSPSVTQYAEEMAASMRRIMADGTVPMLTTIAPKPRSPDHARTYRLAVLMIARELKIPVIDFHAEILRRRPDDWDGGLPQFKQYKGYEVPTLVHGSHPSNPKTWINDFSEEGLRTNGYNLRNYLTIRTYYQVISKVFQAGATP